MAMGCSAQSGHQFVDAHDHVQYNVTSNATMAILGTCASRVKQKLSAAHPELSLAVLESSHWQLVRHLKA